MSFYWIPSRDDNWHMDTIRRMAGGDRILPFLDGTDPLLTSSGGSLPQEKAGSWAAVGEGATLWIAVHGRKYSTEKVTWFVENKQVDWTAGQLVSALGLMLGLNKSRTISYHLLACFGANNITPFAESFGARMASAMKISNMRGSLTAYKGATGMLAARGHQTGSSRITCAASLLRDRLPFGGASRTGPATANSSMTWRLNPYLLQLGQLFRLAGSRRY